MFFGRYLQHSGNGGGKGTFLAILRRGRWTALVTFQLDKKNWSWFQLISSEGLQDFLLRHLKGCVFSDYETTDSFMHVLGLVTPKHQDKRKPATCFKPPSIRYTIQICFTRFVWATFSYCEKYVKNWVCRVTNNLLIKSVGTHCIGTCSATPFLMLWAW